MSNKARGAFFFFVDDDNAGEAKFSCDLQRYRDVLQFESSTINFIERYKTHAVVLGEKLCNDLSLKIECVRWHR